MHQTVEATIDEQGRVRLLEPIHLPEPRRALVTILESEPAAGISETALLSEPALAEDWNRPEEEAAWSHLHPARQEAEKLAAKIDFSHLRKSCSPPQEYFDNDEPKPF